jgi:hypothetical protein
MNVKRKKESTNKREGKNYSKKVSVLIAKREK